MSPTSMSEKERQERIASLLQQQEDWRRVINKLEKKLPIYPTDVSLEIQLDKAREELERVEREWQELSRQEDRPASLPPAQPLRPSRTTKLAGLYNLLPLGYSGQLIGLTVAVLGCVAAWLVVPLAFSGPTPSPTIRATATITPTASVVPGQKVTTPPPTSTPTATPTDTPTPTHTPVPPTPTHTPAPPVSSIPIPSPTSHSTSQAVDSYPAPVLNKPEHGANPSGPPPTFSWRWEGQLQDNEYFDLRMWPEGSADHRIGVVDFRHTPRQPSASGEYVVTVSIVKVGNVDRPGGIYYWSVAVMREVDGEMVDVSPEANPHKLIHDAGGGGGGDDGSGDGGSGTGPRLPPPEP